MQTIDIERIANDVVRDYGLPFRLNSISSTDGGKRIVAFADRHRPGSLSHVSLMCDAKSSAYAVRESLKRALAVND